MWARPFLESSKARWNPCRTLLSTALASWAMKEKSSFYLKSLGWGMCPFFLFCFFFFLFFWVFFHLFWSKPKGRSKCTLTSAFLVWFSFFFFRASVSIDENLASPLRAYSGGKMQKAYSQVEGFKWLDWIKRGIWILLKNLQIVLRCDEFGTYQLVKQGFVRFRHFFCLWKQTFPFS